MQKKITPAAIQALKEALTNVYWYKSDLRSFLSNSISNPEILGKLNWDDYKRNIVGTLITFLTRYEEEYQRDIIRLMDEVSRVNDFSHLKKLEDGVEKEENAKNAVNALKKQLIGNQELREEQQKAEIRREEAHKKLLQVNEVKNRLGEINSEFLRLLSEQNAQKRGYQLEKIMKDLFELFDLDPKSSFKITGEQIDGAFSFDGTDYLLEAKWQKNPIDAKELDSLSSKLSRKLDNTLGLFLSINDYSEDAVKTYSSGRRLILLMDGSDLMAVIEGRIDLVQLLLRKRRKASETGNIYLKIHEIL